jgi:hypothetical protein
LEFAHDIYGNYWDDAEENIEMDTGVASTWNIEAHYGTMHGEEALLQRKTFVATAENLFLISVVKSDIIYMI